MKIRRIKFKDFRCFKDFEVEFSPTHSLHVVIAENMAGKSALLAGIKLMAGTQIQGLLTEPQIYLKDHRILGINPISDIAPEVEIEAEAELISEKGETILTVWKKQKTKPKGGRTTLKTLSGKDPKSLGKSLNIASGKGTAIQPLIGFIGTEYIHVESSETTSWEVNGKSLDGYMDCLRDKSIRKFLFKWLEKIDGLQGEVARKKIMAEAYGDIPQNAIAIFQQAVTQILPDIQIIEWNDDLKEPMVKLTNGEIRPFSVLSDGYRYLILLAGELATRAFILNKHLGQSVLEKIHGLVMIDEFGIHLHPSLQNETLLRLQNAFPKVQFIISTHSPLLLNGLKREQVHILSHDVEGNRHIHHPESDIVGLGADQILKQVFGLATTLDQTFLHWEEEYDQLFRQKQAGKLPEEKMERFRELSKKLAELRLDPTLPIPKDDTITTLVKERMEEIANQESSTLESVKKANGEDVKKQVQTILDELFKTR